MFANYFCSIYLKNYRKTVVTMITIVHGFEITIMIYSYDYYYIITMVSNSSQKKVASCPVPKVVYCLGF